MMSVNKPEKIPLYLAPMAQSTSVISKVETSMRYYSRTNSSVSSILALKCRSPKECSAPNLQSMSMNFNSS
jgi:hypothetical protein